MAYLGLPQQQGLAPQSSTVGTFPQALSVVRATVLYGFQGAQHYVVATDFGPFAAAALGNGRGLLGAQEAGGYLPGQQVYVAVFPGNAGMNAFILGKADLARAGNYTRACSLLVQPQVAGFAPGERYSGAAYSEFGRIKSFNTGLRDVLDGEWVQHNMFGGALGIELFRVFLQAGPMCGLYAYTEDQSMKLVAAKLDILTPSTSTETDILGGQGAEVRKTYFYMGDQTAGWQPQILDATGAPYNGRQTILTYPDGVNGANSRIRPDGEEEEEEEVAGPASRIALIHEHKGADGSYVLSAANSVTLRKTFSVPVPIDVIEAAGHEEEDEEENEAEDEDFCCGGCELTPDPEPVGVKCEDDDNGADEVDPGGPGFDSYRSGHPLAFAMNARGLAARVIARSIGGLTRFPRWQIAGAPDAIYGGRSAEELLFNPDPSMWKNMPQTFELALRPEGTSKRFYWGEACISITEDGSIVLQDAHGSSLMLSGGNVYTTAAHDVINVAGRNRLDVAGRDIGVRGGRHVDVYANEGRLTMMSSGQASLIGGLDGHAGLLLESRGEYGASNSTGENPATSGGVVIRSKHLVSLQSSNIMLRARKPASWSSRQGGAGHIFLDSGNGVEVRADNDQAYYSFGNVFDIDVAGFAAQFGGITSVIEGNLWITKGLFFNRRLFNTSPGQTSYRTQSIHPRGRAFQEAFTHSEILPPEMGDSFAARWLSSEQYTIEGPQFFQIPEPEWQIRANAALPDTSSVRQATMQDNTVDGTAPFPGQAAWSGYALARGGYTDTDFNGEVTVSLTVAPVGADGTLLKGI